MAHDSTFDFACASRPAIPNSRCVRLSCHLIRVHSSGQKRGNLNEPLMHRTEKPLRTENPLPAGFIIKLLHVGSGSTVLESAVGLDNINAFLETLKEARSPTMCLEWITHAYKKVSEKPGGCGEEFIVMCAATSRRSLNLWPRLSVIRTDCALNCIYVQASSRPPSSGR
jgi:hypothetical protein